MKQVDGVTPGQPTEVGGSFPVPSEGVHDFLITAIEKTETAGKKDPNKTWRFLKFEFAVIAGEDEGKAFKYDISL
jgi:hypothetical protein